MTPSMQPGGRASAAPRYLAPAIAAVLAAAGFAALAASFVSYKLVLGKIVGSSHDDQILRGADSLARNFRDILERLRYCGAGFLAAALLAAAYRATLQAWIERAILPLPRFLVDSGKSTVRGLKDDGKLTAWILLALTIAGAAIRLKFLFQPMGIDESETFLSYASRPLYIGLSWYPAPNNHLLNTLLMHIAWRLFGEQEWVVRLPALFAGILVIPATYWAARTVYDKHSALIAAALVTAPTPLIQFSADGRGYTMVCVFSLLLIVASRYLLEHPSAPAWALWAIVAALGFYAIPIMLYPAGTAAVWLIVSSRGMEPEARRRFRADLGWSIALTGVLTTLLYLPVLIASGWRPLFSNGWVQAKSFAYLFAHFPENVSSTWRMWTANVPAPLVWILAVGFGAALLLHRRIPGYGFPIPFAAALSIAPLLLVQRVVPYERVWLFLLPLCAAVSAAGLWLALRTLAGRSSRASAAIALACLSIACIPDLRGTRAAHGAGLPKVEDAVIWMKTRLAPDDAVLVNGFGWSPLTYYFRQHRVSLVSRPSSCNAESLVYTSGGAPPGRTVARERRILIVARSDQNPAAMLAGACLAGQSTRVRLMFEWKGADPQAWSLKIYEAYVAAATVKATKMPMM
jgi:hypothetical protein